MKAQKVLPDPFERHTQRNMKGIEPNMDVKYISWVFDLGTISEVP